MKLSELVIREGRSTVLRHEDPQLIAGVNAPRFCTGFDQGGFGLLILTEEDGLAQPLRMDLDPGYASGLQQG